ncbi:DUF2490 domain-containing protein [Mangrovivirga sp. M17]|uniref:DUF2490 domain-containing protein n=1 Tax=Mangrovivirga halotolerans TaxID=2993936 RepID=A0ABT3RN71_9BACT|nr:DUF2490 domain-containing protein [Mangrovivirga halotolerans]MCX2742783.1 DUF2490 domain-containing protein [Mangrovivirga halotolerans]
MNTKKFFILLILLSSHFYLFSQNDHLFGILPSLNINHNISGNWTLNVKWEGRQVYSQGEANSEFEDLPVYERNDVATLISYKTDLQQVIAMGYLIRFEMGELIHRSIQQYTFLESGYSSRRSHRISADQTFSKVEDSEFRFRYRFTIEKPLSGVKVDEREFYLKINNEYLNILQGGEYDLEIRIVPVIGYKFTEDLKTETGLDYRIDSFINNKASHNYWLSLSIYLSY